MLCKKFDLNSNTNFDCVSLHIQIYILKQLTQTDREISELLYNADRLLQLKTLDDKWLDTLAISSSEPWKKSLKEHIKAFKTIQHIRSEFLAVHAWVNYIATKLKNEQGVKFLEIIRKDFEQLYYMIRII